MPTIPVISVIAADVSIRGAVAKLVESTGFAVEPFVSAVEFLASNRVKDIACLIIDVQLPGMSGLQLQSQLASSGRHIPIIFINASVDEEARRRALQVGAVNFLSKPSGEKALLKAILSTLRLNNVDGQPR